MNAGQFERIMGMLEQIRDRMPETASPSPALARVVRDVPIREDVPARPSEKPVERSMSAAVALGHRQALAAFLAALDDWIDGARENHTAMGHSNELVGAECWTQFHPSDIRHMVNDAARQVGLPEFPIPAAPKKNAK